MDENGKIDTRTAKGQATRDRLLAEALRLFAIKGFEAVGTRELAAAAGTNIASIAFHFGGKEGLYGEVVRHVAATLASLYQNAFAAAQAESRAKGEEPIRRAHRVIAKLIAALAASNRSRWMSLLLQREFITPTACFDTLYEEAIRPCLEEFSQLVEATAGLAAESLDNRVLAYSLFTMASAFSRNGNFLRFTGKTGYAPQDIDAIGRAVAGFIDKGLRPSA
ncbi:MAG: hypothetical protein AUJ49_10100 [Desulfovibrionaceae bacterium CG1_02_65_16]|nr:MAG: hypothetical protein AUJ49_10100 [Desulfovibrionaceae bacterium CG1_02_65_16]